MAEDVKPDKTPWPLCFNCGHQCVWSCDYPGDEYGLDDRENEDGTIEKAEEIVVSIWTCPHCGTEYEVVTGPGPFEFPEEEDQK